MGASFNQFRNHIWGPFHRDMLRGRLHGRVVPAKRVDTILLEYKQYKPVGISAKYKYLNQQHSVGKVVLKYNKYTIFNRFLTLSIKLLSITNLNELLQPG